MKKNSLESNLKIMMILTVFGEPLFWGPILILTLQHLAHMSLREIFIIEATCVVICLIIDIPTGALSDIIGRKKVLIIAEIFLFFSFIFFALMTKVWHVWIGNLLWAVGAAFNSGTEQALIQETCLALEKEKDFYRIYSGKVRSYQLLLMAFCAPMATMFAETSLRLPLLLSLPTLVIPVVCVFFLTEPPQKKRELSGKKHFNQMIRGLRDLCRNPQILWITTNMCIIGLVSKIWFFNYNPYFEVVNLKMSEFGIIFFLLNMIAWFSSRYGHKIEKRMGNEKVVWILIPILGIPVLLMGLFPIPLMAYLVLFQNIIRGMYNPFINSMTEKFLKNETRATVLSVQSSIVSVMVAIGLWTFGEIIDKNGLLHSLVILGILAMIGHLILMINWPRLFLK